jgi:hypothetical protein
MDFILIMKKKNLGVKALIRLVYGKNSNNNILKNGAKN